MIQESLCSGKGMTRFKVDNNVKNLRAAILQHSDVSLAAGTMVTNLTSLSTPSHSCLLLIIRTMHGSVSSCNLCNLCLE